MKSILRVALWLVPVVLAIIGPSTLACSNPPPETVDHTWQPLAQIQVLPDINSLSAAQTVVANWNQATFYYCYAPVFTFSPGTGEQLTVDWVTMPPNPNGTIPRGKTFITISLTTGRIASATTWLSNAILQTFPNTLVDVLAHEVGHTMGLDDCDYSPACPLYSTVMENLAPVPIWATEGQPGPTPCDLSVMIGVATGYACLPNPPSGCNVTETCQEGYAWNDVDCACEPGASPILIDVSGKGFELTNAASGVKFDISARGIPMQMAWTAPGAQNAFLCLPDSNGACDDGKDLFGNFTPQPASSTPNGFAALAVYDANHDGVIDARDAIFSKLRLWIDANHDGISQPNELFTLPGLGITSISLNYKWDRRTDQYGNVFRYRAQVGSTDGAGRMAYDVFLVSQPSGTGTAAAMKACPPRPTVMKEKTLLR